MTIFEIDALLMQALTQVDEDTGLWTGAEAYAALEMERDAKLEATALVVKEAKAEANAIAEEIKRLQERKRAAEATADRCTNLLRYSLNGEKFKTPKVSISYRSSKSTVIDDTEAFTAWALNHNPSLVKLKPEPVKTEIAKAIEAGAEVRGAHIEVNTSVVIK